MVTVRGVCGVSPEEEEEGYGGKGLQSLLLKWTGHVVATVKPSITEMGNITQREGSRVVLSCRTRGDPPPTITFQKDDQKPFSRGDNVRALL